MLSKKLNDPFYWKNKLEALNSLPGEGTHEKDAMWEKLNSRLQQKPAAGKAKWYWMAAGLIPLFIIAILMVSKTDRILIKPATVKVEKMELSPSYLQPASTEAVTLSIADPVEKKQPAIVAVDPEVKSENFNDTIRTTNIVVPLLPEQKETGMATTDMQLTDTSTSVATVTTFKPKLRIVHINDLETYPAQFCDPVNYEQAIKSRKSKSNDQNVATQQNAIGFKIKLSSKN